MEYLIKIPVIDCQGLRSPALSEDTNKNVSEEVINIFII